MQCMFVMSRQGFLLAAELPASFLQLLVYWHRIVGAEKKEIFRHRGPISKLEAVSMTTRVML